jgi:hypothetical protein
VPIGLRATYVCFVMRTIVGVAPNIEELTRGSDGLNVPAPAVSSRKTCRFC